MKPNLSRRTFITTAVLSGLSAGTASAGFFDSIKDALTGHTTDIRDRLTHTDAYAGGNIQLSNNFRENDPGNDSAHWVSGTVQVVRDPTTGTSYVQLQDNFKSGLAPDLYLYISTEMDFVKDEDDFWASNPIEVAKLTSGSGASFYELPEGISPYAVQSVTIWCKRFGEFMGSADL